MAHVDQNSVEIRQTQLAKSAAVMLSDGALALFVTYAIVVAFDILPPRLLDPAWMMKLALSLSVNMAIPLAAIAFLQVAAGWDLRTIRFKPGVIFLAKSFDGRCSVFCSCYP